MRGPSDGRTLTGECICLSEAPEQAMQSNTRRKSSTELLLEFIVHILPKLASVAEPRNCIGASVLGAILKITSRQQETLVHTCTSSPPSKACRISRICSGTRKRATSKPRRNFSNGPARRRPRVQRSPGSTKWSGVGRCTGRPSLATISTLRSGGMLASLLSNAHLSRRRLPECPIAGACDAVSR